MFRDILGNKWVIGGFCLPDSVCRQRVSSGTDTIQQPTEKR